MDSRLARPRTGNRTSGRRSASRAATGLDVQRSSHRIHIGATGVARAQARACHIRFLARDMRPYLKRAAPDHVEGNVENDREPEISDPAMFVEQSCNESRSGTHQYDRKQETKDKRGRM